MPDFNPNPDATSSYNENSTTLIPNASQPEERILEQNLNNQNLNNRDNVIQGLSEEELKDPNRIAITISDETTPIVVLFGPPNCGKTMTLVRLTRYLKDYGYKIEPIRSFRPSKDSHYARMCDNFNNEVNNDEAASSTSLISFMLVRVIDKNGRTICQILEAPGEYYYNPEKPNQPFPSYVNTIKSSPNRRIWCFMLEPDWKDRQDRSGYVDKIHVLKRNMGKSDKVIFLFNKIDMTPFQMALGKVNLKNARKEVENLYHGIFTPFRQKDLLFGSSDRFAFIPFQTGDYTETLDNKYTFQPGSNEYPKQLWNTILKIVKG